uniref:Cysteine sulfinic acid decarboxylase n=1 Tax=Lygus hesperus TaxID=30085 RepID=A0A146KM83_LYGHE
MLYMLLIGYHFCSACMYVNTKNPFTKDFFHDLQGTDGLEKHVNRVFENAEYFTEKIRRRPGFKLVLDEPECTNVTFWYVPPSLRGRENEPEYNQRLHRVAPLIKERMTREGTMLMTYQPLKELPNFFRLVIQNSALNTADMDYIVTEFERLGRNL